ncbi:hypothetical protein SXY01_19520 [Staphylococcus xylosus]|nr:hypothetical protein SXY01_19520 [Staphylococcus xylosus]
MSKDINFLIPIYLDVLFYIDVTLYNEGINDNQFFDRVSCVVVEYCLGW